MIRGESQPVGISEISRHQLDPAIGPAVGVVDRRDVVALHPAVSEVAAIGAPDEKSGEVVKIFVVVKIEVTIEELMAHCRKNLVGYKVPKFIEFRTELPKTNVGKILRRALRDAK